MYKYQEALDKLIDLINIDSNEKYKQVRENEKILQRLIDKEQERTKKIAEEEWKKDLSMSSGF